MMPTGNWKNGDRILYYVQVGALRRSIVKNRVDYFR
jgi:hypothetical protein